MHSVLGELKQQGSSVDPSEIIRLSGNSINYWLAVRCRYSVGPQQRRLHRGSHERADLSCYYIKQRCWHGPKGRMNPYMLTDTHFIWGSVVIDENASVFDSLYSDN